MSRALAENARQSVRYWKGLPHAPSDSLFIGNYAHTFGQSKLPKKTLNELYEEFIKDPSANRQKGSMKNFDSIFRLVKEVIGGTSLIQDITREDCKAVRDLLLKIPRNATKKAKGKTFSQAAEIAAKKNWNLLGSKSVNNYLGTFSSLLNFAVKEGYLTNNPAKGLKIKIKEKTKKRVLSCFVYWNCSRKISVNNSAHVCTHITTDNNHLSEVNFFLEFIAEIKY